MRRLDITNNVYAGTPIMGLLFIVLTTLKLTGYIDWSWWWITAPLWGVLAVFLVGLGIFLMVLTIITMLSSARKK